MKKTTLPLLVLLAFFSSVATARIYKTVDEHGNVVFTDQPSRSLPSEKVILKPITQLLPPEVADRPYNQPVDPLTNDSTQYDAFAIINPANNSTVRDNGNFAIKISVKPNLDRGHKVRFSINNKAVTGPQRSLSYQVKNLERGTHHLKAELLNESGNVVQSVNSTVHVQRTIYRPPVAAPGG